MITQSLKPSLGYSLTAFFQYLRHLNAFELTSWSLLHNCNSRGPNLWEPAHTRPQHIFTRWRLLCYPEKQISHWKCYACTTYPRTDISILVVASTADCLLQIMEATKPPNFASASIVLHLLWQHKKQQRVIPWEWLIWDSQLSRLRANRFDCTFEEGNRSSELFCFQRAMDLKQCHVDELCLNYRTYNRCPLNQSKLYETGNAAPFRIESSTCTFEDITTTR